MTRGGMQRTGWNKRLLASTRGRILALLRSENRTVNELAAALRLTDNAVRAHLFEMVGDYESAIKHYRIAASRTTSIPEQNYLMTQAACLAERKLS